MQSSADGRGYTCLFSRRVRESRDFLLDCIAFSAKQALGRHGFLKELMLYWTFKEVLEACVVVLPGAVA